jgi:hypothetical protein
VAFCREGGIIAVAPDALSVHSAEEGPCAEVSPGPTGSRCFGVRFCAGGSGEVSRVARLWNISILV